MEKSPFELTFNYNDKQIINQNFTITTELYHDIHLPINCKNNQYRLCLVELSLQIQSDIMSINFWCQPPAFSFENFNQFSRFHTCILPMVNATEQPSITMIINSYDKGKLIPLATANFTNSPQYNVEKKSKTPIFIFNNENITKETLLSRNVRYLMTENDDAIESELDEPDCIMETTNQTNGISNQDDPLSKDDEPDETAAPVDFASDIIPEDDRSQPIGEYDDSLAVNCTAGGPIYGHPNIEWIRVANASYFTIDQRINRNADPDSDGIDFPKMDTYILQIRMIPYIFLQYVSVPSSNVILLYVVVHYDSGRRHNAYQSKVEQSPVVENFLAKEPTRFFEVYLNATDDGLPPSDVTLDIGYCIAPKHKHPIIVDSDSSFDSFTGTIDVDTYANIPDNSGSISPYTINKPSISTDTLVPSQNLLDTVDVNINVGSDGNVGQELVNNDRGPMIMDNTGPITQSVIIDGGRIPSINYEAQKPTDVRIPSDALVGTVDVSGAAESSPSLQILSQPSALQVVDTGDRSPAITNQNELNDMQVKSPALIGTVQMSILDGVASKPYSSDTVPLPSLGYNNLPSMTPSQVPAHYSCYNNLQIVGNINIQNIFHLNNLQQTTISDIINSQSQSSGYSFPSFHYPYHTIVINLRINIYVHTLTLGPQSNLQQYRLRLYNPLRNVDDTYYSSKLPEFNNQPTIVGIPLAKVAIRLYLNLYTTNDGRPPSNIKIMINACFDLSSMNSISSPMIGGQYFRSPSISQIPTVSQQQQPYYQSPFSPGMSMPTMNVAQPSNIDGTVDVSIIDPSASTDNRIPSSPLIGTIDINEIIGRQPGSFGSMPSPNKPVPFSRTPGQCFDQILIIGGSHITMIRSRNPTHQIVGPEINFGGTGYTFSSPSDTYEFEIHFAQPFTMKYVFIPYSANVESFKVEASHAGMLGVFTSTNTKDGLVVDGFPTMLVSMLVITIIHTTDGYLPSHITLNIGVCNPIYSPSNEGNETPEMIDCTPQLRLLGNPKQVTRVDIKTPTIHIKPNNLINPNQDGMDFPTTEEYIIDIVLSKTMSMDSITLNPLSNVDSFKIQCHNSHGYYLEIKSIIGWKTINGLANTQANLIRIILLGTEDGNPPNHISIKIAACIPTGLPKIMRSPFKHELITKRRKPSKYNINRFNIPEDQLTMTYTEQQIPISEELFQPDIVQSPTSVELTANVDVQPIQDSAMGTLSSPILEQPPTSIAYLPLINSQSQFIQNQIPERNTQAQTDIVVETIRQPIIQTQSSPVIMLTPIFTASNVNQPLQSQQFIEKPLPSPALPLSPPNLQAQESILVLGKTQPSISLPPHLTRSPSGYTCSHNYQITTNVHINNIYTLCGCSQSSLMDSTSSNSLFNNNGYSFSSHHYPFQTIVISLKFTGYVQSLSLGSKSNVQKYGLRVFNPLRNVDDTYYSSIDPNTGQPTISNIHIAKVAIRLYINLYTTNDGRPPRNIQFNFNICFDLRSSSNGDRRFVMIEEPVISSSILMPERTEYIPQQQIVSPSIPQAPILSPIVHEPVPSISQETYVIHSQPLVLSPTMDQPVMERPISPIDTDTDFSSMPSMEQPMIHMVPSPIIQEQITVQIIDNTYPSHVIPSAPFVSAPSDAQLIQQSNIIQRPLSSSILPSISVQVPVPQITQPSISLPPHLTRSPSGYTCSHNYQITTNVHINNIYTLCGCSQSSLMDSTSSNSLFNNNGYSFSSHHYPFQTIVISLKFTGYVQSLSLGSKSNVQKYGLRVFNPLRNVDDTYYSSIDPNTGQPTISNIHIAKVAIRLYINLYTTNDGRPPRNIQFNFNICFDLRSSSNGDRKFVMIEEPVISSSILMPERIEYIPQQQIVIQSTLKPNVQILPSPIIPASLIVQISPSPTIIGTRIFDQSSSSDAEIPVVIEQQQPIVSSQVPSAVIETIFSPIQLVPQEIVRIQPSPAMHAPIVDTSASISIIEQPSVANIRRPVPLLQQQQQQQPMVAPPAPTAVISNIFSPIQSIPQTIVLTQPSPIIDASIVNVSATIQFIEKPIIYQPSPIKIPQTNIIQQPIPAISSSMPSPVIIRTIFSEIQPPPEETVLRLPSPAIDTPRIPAPAYDTLSSPHITGQMTVQVIEHTYSSRIIPSPSSAVSSSYAQPIEQQPVFERTLPSGMIPSISIEPPPIIETDATMVPSSIPSSRISTEMCSCQCPISGLVPIVYNNRQQSCTIGTIRKR
ncbi:unnamed protein product [Rotaria sordida]|uniref:Uncharacterized protein n=1 Tax=Rotaria sordida TaxID=392033 RepID=A0A814MCP9_9BILA|nr:unnamed protein product [Rotaria sordida]